jgi:hypothetical protein
VSHRQDRARSISEPSSPEIEPNQTLDSGVAVMTTRPSVVPRASQRANRARAIDDPGRSRWAMTTSLYAAPTLRKRKTSPLITGSTASESRAFGMRPTAALKTGRTPKKTRDVSDSGT